MKKCWLKTNVIFADYLGTNERKSRQHYILHVHPLHENDTQTELLGTHLIHTQKTKKQNETFQEHCIRNTCPNRCCKAALPYTICTCISFPSEEWYVFVYSRISSSLEWLRFTKNWSQSRLKLMFCTSSDRIDFVHLYIR